MHLIVDARTIRPGCTGVGHYVAGLLTGLDELVARHDSPEIKVTALRLPSRHPPWNQLQHVATHSVRYDYESHPAGDYWMQTGLPSLVRHLRGDVLLSPAFQGPWGARRHFRRHVVIPDSIAWELPFNLPRGFGSYLRAGTRLSALGADRVLSLSPSAASRLQKLGFGGKRGVGVIPCAVDMSTFYPAEEKVTALPDGTPKNQPVVLYTASFEARKNHALLFDALRRERLSKHNPLLVLLHRAGKEEVQRVRSLSADVPVRIIGCGSPEETAAWTRAADVAVMPSLMEGFGIPALEAMASGVPLVASDIDVMRWLTQNGRCAELIDPHDPGGWAGAIERALRNGSGIQRRRGEALVRARKFSPLASARVLMREIAQGGE